MANETLGNELDTSGTLGGDEDSSSDSDSDLMIPVYATRKKEKRKRESSTEDSDFSKDPSPVSPASSDDESHDPSPSSREGSQSPETPGGQREVAEILDFARDDFAEHYLIKWKDPESEDTWEVAKNLPNCDDEMLRFYRKRKQDVKEALENNEYILLSNGKRRKKMPVRDVPPDPRPLDVRVQEFFEVNANIADEVVVKVLLESERNSTTSKTPWPKKKINKFLEDGIDGKLSESDIKALINELI
ncbi:unnamed protein product [Orchesella dallaii]|uniref:Chromo domain-containing protein n=1 Tax=Orchesella dallaii TaxID=48710 RepID=A0ABP1PY63_9HEXA